MVYIPCVTCIHRYLWNRLSLQVFYLWRHVLSTAPPFILWWSNLEILFAPLHRSSPFIGGLRCQAIQTEHGPYSRKNPKSNLYCEVSMPVSHVQKKKSAEIMEVHQRNCWVVCKVIKAILAPPDTFTLIQNRVRILSRSMPYAICRPNLTLRSGKMADIFLKNLPCDKCTVILRSRSRIKRMRLRITEWKYIF
jgi:hypothetical protein